MVAHRLHTDYGPLHDHVICQVHQIPREVINNGSPGNGFLRIQAVSWNKQALMMRMTPSLFYCDIAALRLTA